MAENLAPEVSVGTSPKPHVIPWSELVDRLGSRAAARDYIENASTLTVGLDYLKRETS